MHPLRSDKELGFVAAFALFCVLPATVWVAAAVYGFGDGMWMWSDQSRMENGGLTQVWVYSHNDIYSHKAIKATLRLPLYPLFVIGPLAFAGVWLNIALLQRALADRVKAHNAPRPARIAPRTVLVALFVIDLLLVVLAVLQWFELRSGCDDLARGWNGHLGNGGNPLAMVCLTTQNVTGETQDQTLGTPLVLIAGLALLAAWCNLTGLAQNRRATRLLRDGHQR